MALATKARPRIPMHQETIGKKILRYTMSPDEKAEMRKKAMNTMNRLRDGMSPDERAKMREKAKNTMNTLRDSMSPDKNAKMRENKTIGRK